MNYPMPDHIARLPVRDRMLHAIGRAAQAQAEMERGLRGVHMAFTGPTPGIVLASKRGSVEQLQHDCVAMLKQSDLDESLQADITAVLSAAVAADQDRHRAVHEVWYAFEDPVSGETEMFSVKYKGSVVGASTPRDLAFLDEAVTALQSVSFRLHCLAEVLHFELPYWPDFEMPDVESQRAMVRGEFEPIGDGGFRPHQVPASRVDS